MRAKPSLTPLRVLDCRAWTIIAGGRPIDIETDVEKTTNVWLNKLRLDLEDRSHLVAVPAGYARTQGEREGATVVKREGTLLVGVGGAKVD